MDSDHISSLAARFSEVLLRKNTFVGLNRRSMLPQKFFFFQESLNLFRNRSLIIGRHLEFVSGVSQKSPFVAFRILVSCCRVVIQLEARCTKYKSPARIQWRSRMYCSKLWRTLYTKLGWKGERLEWRGVSQRCSRQLSFGCIFTFRTGTWLASVVVPLTGRLRLVSRIVSRIKSRIISRIASRIELVAIELLWILVSPRLSVRGCYVGRCGS